MSRPARIALYVVGGLFGLILLAVLAAFLIIPSKWFEDKVRDRVVYELERSSGGRAEIGKFHFDWKSLTATLDSVTLHGTEPAGADPLVRVQQLRVGLKIISLLNRDVNIAMLHVEKPQVNLLVDANGITNIPKPKTASTSNKDPIESILDLAVGDFSVSGGSIHYSDKAIPVDVRGQNLDVHLNYEKATPRYAGTLKFEQLHLESGQTKPMDVAFESKIKLEKNRLGIDSARLAMPHSNISISGEVADFKAPKASFDVGAVGDLAELGPPLNLPPPHVGLVKFTGKGTYTSGDTYQLAGKVSGRDLAIAQGGMRINNIAIDSDMQFNKDQLLLQGLVLKALGGSFTGKASLTDNFKQAKVNGNLNGFNLRQLAATQGVKNLQWSGVVSGPIDISTSLTKGSNDLKAAGTVNITPVAGPSPVDGKVELAYDQKSGAIKLGNSYLNTGQTHLNIAGTYGSQLNVRLETANLNDFLPAIAMASKNPPKELPVKLVNGGNAVFTGTILGSAKDPQISGNLQARGIEVQQEQVDTLNAQIQANKSGAHLSSVAVGQGAMRLTGNADVGLRNWSFEDNALVTAKVKLENASIGKLLTKAGQKVPVDGTLNVTADVKGTANDPAATVQIAVLQPTVYGEKFDRVTAQVNYAGGGVELINGAVQVGSARLDLNGAYTHPATDWKNGQLRFEARSRGFQLAQFKTVQDARPGIKGGLDLNAQGRANVRNAEVLLSTLTGHVAVSNLVVDNKQLGSFNVDAQTAGEQLTVAARGNLRDSQIVGNGTFQLTGDYQSKGELSFSPVTLATIQDLTRSGPATGQQAPVDGVVEGKVTFAGPARKPDLMTARLELPTLRVNPTQRAGALAKAPRKDLTFRNEGPIVAELDPTGVHIRNAHFVGPDTDLKIAGTVNMKSKNPWDVHAEGDMNLGLLEDFDNDIVSSGTVNLNATVRGTLDNPQLGGRLTLKNASLYQTDFPNGLDQANGTIVFDRNRATIESLTATTGGGKVAMSGFVGFGGGDMVFRLQARADGVRIRYPEGVSFAANAALTLNGTAEHSVLSGVVTVLRAGFNPRTDVGGLLAASSQPVQTPSTPNELLRNLQMDVRVETVPNLQFQTSLTQDLQAEADLRIRGTAAKPTVLGRINVNQGEIQFFGNKYTINRGEIGFYNPVRIEPVLDLDLETTVRGILVTINFAGSINKLNVSYRSDPPLQSNEIIALLAVGRAPGETTGLAASQTVSQNNMLMTGTNTLLGQAIAAPVSSRLQRFFGVSRLKIDPSLQNLDAIPQARLTLEQQISKDVTLTYITNLSNANQQIVRLQWDINKNWSVLAVREETGLFGVDFLYKKRFR